MNDLYVIEDPSTKLASVAVNEILDRVDNIVNSYKEYKMCEAVEATKRTAYREQARIEIARLEEATKQYVKKCDDEKEKSLALINTLNNILQQRDILDDNMTKICLSIIDKVMSW